MLSIDATLEPRKFIILRTYIIPLVQAEWQAPDIVDTCQPHKVPLFELRRLRIDALKKTYA